MSVITIIETIKEIHPEYVVLVKVGEFYHAYGKDSYIISYLFGYKLKKSEKNISSCGFPRSAMNKILASLEKSKINYLLLDQRNNYEVDSKVDNKNQNSYKKTFDKAYNYVRLKNRLDTIYEYMLDNIEGKDFKDILIKMEEILYERREV